MRRSRILMPVGKRQETLGERLQRSLDAIDAAVATRRLAAGLLGVGLALAVVLGGLAMFAIVWALLVGVIH